MRLAVQVALCVGLCSQLVETHTAANQLLDPSFAYDGTEATIDKQFYYLSKTSSSLPDKFSALSLPKHAKARLDKYGVHFSDLNPWLQQAFLWDSGLVLEKSSSSKLVQVYTRCGSSMSGIAVTTPNYKAINCTVNPNCSSYAPRNGVCSGDTISKASLCASDNVEQSIDAAMWATGGSPTSVPEPNIARHQWSDDGRQQLIFAIHMLDSTEVRYMDCPKKGEAGLIIPCVDKASSDAKWCVPSPGQLVTDWLEKETGNAGTKGQDKGFNLLWLVLIFGIIIVVIIIVFIIVILRRHKKRQNAEQQAAAQTRSSVPSEAPFHAYPPHQPHPPPLNKESQVEQPSGDPYVVNQAPPPYAQHLGRESNTDTMSRSSERHGSESYVYQRGDGSSKHRRDSHPRHGNSHNPTLSHSSNGSHASQTAQPYSLVAMENLLLADAEVARSCISFRDIEFQQLLARGAFGEFWLCQYLGRQRVVKQLLPHRASTQKEVNDFIDEIKLTASLDHSNIVRYIGVTWRSVDTLGMVLEHLPRGDLLSYLRNAGERLTWPKAKLLMAVGIARAIEYLHARRTAIIHRDLKAKNVLLTEQLDAKLIDFGISRDRVQETMTAAVGTPYWSAPEVLDGRRYTEKSDIYSFGVLLSEIDNGEIPYQHLKSQRTGETMQPLEILNRIVSGDLRPSFKPSCPARILRVATLCLDREPERRPSASEAVGLLLSTDVMPGGASISGGLD